MNGWRTHRRSSNLRRAALVLACALTAAACASAPRAAPAKPPRPTAWQGPADLIRQLRGLAIELKAAGLQPSGPALAGFLLAGNHATLPLVIPAGRCMTIVSRATRGARDVDAALYTAEGALLAIDSESDAHPTLEACAHRADARVYYVIQFYEGDGSFAVLPFYGPRSALAKTRAAVGGKPAFAEIVPAPEVGEDPLTAFTEGLRKRGYHNEGEPRRFAIAQGERVRENLQVEAGRCYTVAAFGSKGIAELKLRLMDEHDTELSVADERRPGAATQLCARANAQYSVESSAVAGAGQVLLLVYSADALTAGGDAGLWLGERSLAAKQPAPASQ